MTRGKSKAEITSNNFAQVGKALREAAAISPVLHTIVADRATAPIVAAVHSNIIAASDRSVTEHRAAVERAIRSAYTAGLTDGFQQGALAAEAAHKPAAPEPLPHPNNPDGSCGHCAATPSAAHHPECENYLELLRRSNT